MMHDRDIAKICLLLVIVGIAALFLITETIKPVNIKMEKIDNSMVGSSVRVAGMIKTISSTEGNIFMSLYDGGSMKAVMFKSDAQKNPGVYNLTKNDNITVVGEVSTYQGELEIIIKSIEDVNHS